MKLIITSLLILLISVNVSGNTSTQLTLDGASSISFTTECGQYKYFYVDVPSTAACKDIIIDTTVSAGETDIYVSKTNTFPTSSMETWAAYADGVYDVTISRWDPESSPGRYYIGVYADCANTNTAATYTIKATSDATNDNTDILLTPTLAQNFGLTADGYKYFRFCVPNDDKDVKIELKNCYVNGTGAYIGTGNCNVNTYTLPELIVTRNIIKPTVADLGYKLATQKRRDVNILASDQAGNNPYGYHSGVYYVGVHGWCTPAPYCTDPSWMGCCTNYANTPPMEVNVTLTPGTAQTSEMSWNDYTYALGGTGYIDSGEKKSYTVTCNQYRYYGFKVPSPCYDLNIFLHTTSNEGNPAANVAELSIGTYPNNYPDGIRGTGNSSEWTSYNWGDNNLTISAFDPNFEGGYNCGPDKDKLCVIIIGVYAYCTNTSTPYDNFISYELTPTLIRAKKIFGTPQTSQTFSSQVSGGDVNTYQFCVLDNEDVTVQLQSYYSSCQCQNKYADLEMWISKYNSEATINDLAWRVGHGTADKTLYLETSDTDTRTGSYYLYVSGYCNSQCSSDSCTCNPCDNLGETEYAVNVDYSNSIKLGNLLPSCGNKGTCSNQCDNKFELSEGAKAGIAIGVIVFSMIIGALGYIAYMKYVRKHKYIPDTSHEEVELTFQHHNHGNSSTHVRSL